MVIKRCLVALSVLPALLPALLSVADVYRCEGPTGELVFTDRQCLSGQVQTRLPEPALPVVSVKSAKSVAPEVPVLIELDKRIAKSRQNRIHARKVRGRKLARANALKEKNCAAAKRQLGQLFRQKRQGYRLSEAGLLESRQRDLLTSKSQNCR